MHDPSPHVNLLTSVVLPLAVALGGVVLKDLYDGWRRGRQAAADPISEREKRLTERTDRLIAGFEGRITALEAQVSGLEAQLHTKAEDAKLWELSAGAAHLRADEAQAELRKVLANMELLQIEKAALAHESEETRRMSEEARARYDARIAELQRHIDALQREITALRDESAELREGQDRLLADGRRNAGQIDRIRQEHTAIAEILHAAPNDTQGTAHEDQR